MLFLCEVFSLSEVEILVCVLCIFRGKKRRFARLRAIKMAYHCFLTPSLCLDYNTSLKYLPFYFAEAPFGNAGLHLSLVSFLQSVLAQYCRA